MNRTNLTLMGVLVLLLATVVVGQSNQPVNQPQQSDVQTGAANNNRGNGVTGDPKDPFAEDRVRVLALQNQWLTLNTRLEDVWLLNPCSGEARAHIAAIEKAGRAALDAQRDYYTKWRRHVAERDKRVSGLQDDQILKKSEITEVLNRERMEKADLERRKQILASNSGAQKPTSRTAAAISWLEELIGYKQETVEKLEQALGEIDEGVEYLGKAQDLAKQRQAIYGTLLSRLAGESLLWEQFYRSTSAKLELVCGESQPSPRQLEIKNPNPRPDRP